MIALVSLARASGYRCTCKANATNAFTAIIAGKEAGMANFNTHISTSALLGIGYGAVGHTVYQMPLPASILASGLCTVAGILPDVDADRGHSLREIMAFLAAVIPVLVLDRFRHRAGSPGIHGLGSGGVRPPTISRCMATSTASALRLRRSR